METKITSNRGTILKKPSDNFHPANCNTYSTDHINVTFKRLTDSASSSNK